jgi:hypothetical protein
MSSSFLKNENAPKLRVHQLVAGGFFPLKTQKNDFFENLNK